MGLPSLLSSLPRSASASPSPSPSSFLPKIEIQFLFSPLSLLFSPPPPFRRLATFPSVAGCLLGWRGWLCHLPAATARGRHSTDPRSSIIRGERRRTVGSLVLCLLLFGAFKSSCVAFPNFSPREAWFLWAVWMYRSGDLKGFSTKLMFESVSPWLNVGDFAAAFEYDKGRQ